MLTLAFPKLHCNLMDFKLDALIQLLLNFGIIIDVGIIIAIMVVTINSLVKGLVNLLQILLL